MNKKTKKVLSIIALVFMGIFTISLVVWLAAPKLWNGSVGYLTLFSGSVGIGLFLIIKFVKTPEEKEELAKIKAAYLPTADDAPVEKTDASINADSKNNNAPLEKTDATKNDSKNIVNDKADNVDEIKDCPKKTL